MSSKSQLSLFGGDEDGVEPSSAQPAMHSAVAPPLRISPLPPPGNWMKCKMADDCEWVAFLKKHGRVPQVSDEKKPWDYPGWLMYYRILLEENLEIPARWDYWFRTMIAGQLLDEPIPKLDFTCGGERSEGYKQIESWIRLIDRFGGGWSSPMTVLLDWLLWGFGLNPEQPSLSPELHEHLYRSVNLAPLLLEPHDYWGEWIANQKGKWNIHAFFPTPEHAVELMVQINFAGIGWREARSLTVCDPCMGTGRMLLSSAGYSLRLFGMDIDAEVIRAAKVNGILYAPWLVRPFPEHFFADRETPE